ncbi:MAG: dihydrodipicolinate synthase family protein [Limisphaerales bacterium]
MSASLVPAVARALARGLVIPACPLALTSERKLDERRQRALVRYYVAAGAGGLAAGVHTTQFEIREPKVGLFAPVLELIAEELDRGRPSTPEPLVRIAGICGATEQAVSEAALAKGLGYQAGLLSLGALKTASEEALLAHCREVAAVVPLVGFYLQEAVGGRGLSYAFWARFAQIENVAAIKIAAFNRYHTIDVVRAITESGREDIALYTGNDDNIVVDLLTPFRFNVGGQWMERRIVGGLLGHWAVWTSKAVELLDECHRAASTAGPVPAELLRRAAEITDANAAIFDSAHDFRGCIPGIHEILRRQGLLEGIWTLYAGASLSAGQLTEIERVCTAYPHLNDDGFVQQHREEWLRR